MLTAQSKITQDNNLPTGATAMVSGFGNVLKSVQGLQQRLSDFSVDEVTEAETNANNLIHRITLAQERLNELASLKRTLLAVADTTGKIPEIDFDLISPSSLDKHPQLHAIVKTSKIIRLHRLLKVAKASEQSVSFDSEVGRLEIGTPLAPTIAATRAEKYPEKLSRTSPEQATKAATWLSSDVTTGVIELPPPPVSIEVDPGHTLSTGTETTNHEKDARPLTPSSSASLVVEHSEKLVQWKNTAVVAEPASLSGGRSATKSDTTIDVDSLTSDHEFPLLAPPKTETVDGAGPNYKMTPEFEDERSLSRSDSAFNQRLLDDLIQNYGEFFATPHRPAKPAAIHIDTPIAREPKFVEKETLALIEEMTADTAKATASSTRSHGELDRQLKKIIKDYGENDIYSHQSSLTLKNGGIAAFIVLVLVLVAVYFFRHSPQVTPQPVPTAQHKQTSTSLAPGSPKETSAALAAGANQKPDNNSDAAAPRKTKQKQKP